MNVVLGTNYEQSTFDRLDVTRNGLIFPDAENINLALGQSITTGGNYEKWAILGGFYRLNYNYDERYLLELERPLRRLLQVPDEPALRLLPLRLGRVASVARAVLEGPGARHLGPQVPRLVRLDGQRQHRRVHVQRELFNITQVQPHPERDPAAVHRRAGGAAGRADVGDGHHAATSAWTWRCSPAS